MVSLKRSQTRLLNELFQPTPGYVLDFSNSAFAEFFEEEFGVDIYDDKYAFNGTSKGKHLNAFIELEPVHWVVPVLKRLFDLRLEDGCLLEDDPYITRFNELIDALSRGIDMTAIPALEARAKTIDFDTVGRDLERALNNAATDPEDAVTAACSTIESVCRSILIELDVPLPDKKDAKSLFRAVRTPLGLSPDQSITDKLIAADILTTLNGLSAVVTGIASLRTHAGDAHGREKGFRRIDERIASLAIHSASSISLFLIDTWQRKFPSRVLPRHD